MMLLQKYGLSLVDFVDIFDLLQMWFNDLKKIYFTFYWKLYINNNMVHALIGQKGRWM